MFLVSSRLVRIVTKTIRSMVQFLGHTPRSCYRVHTLTNLATAGVRADRVMSKNNITFFIDTRVPAT